MWGSIDIEISLCYNTNQKTYQNYDKFYTKNWN